MKASATRKRGASMPASVYRKEALTEPLMEFLRNKGLPVVEPGTHSAVPLRVTVMHDGRVLPMWDTKLAEDVQAQAESLAKRAFDCMAAVIPSLWSGLWTLARVEFSFEKDREGKIFLCCPLWDQMMVHSGKCEEDGTPCVLGTMALVADQFEQLNEL